MHYSPERVVMTKKKKRAQKNQKTKEAAFTNNPFKNLKPVTKSSVSATTKDTVDIIDTPQSLHPADSDILDEMMYGATPLKTQKRVVTVKKPDDLLKKIQQTNKPTDDDFLFEETSLNWDINIDAGHLSGVQNGIPERTFTRLKRGDYLIENKIDLHGRNTLQAKKEVLHFIKNSHAALKKCVLIIHGKGNTSPDHISKIKEHLPLWLSSKELSKYVIAFTSAQPSDGGTGALYVLLKK